uniref:Putative secreted protein n=1 Tax=Anopheles marajoara TaxID=58244 RepID=A0A2M4CE94_9DIPT
MLQFAAIIATLLPWHPSSPMEGGGRSANNYRTGACGMANISGPGQRYRFAIRSATQHRQRPPYHHHPNVPG